jgi:hypothetical protein
VAETLHDRSFTLILSSLAIREPRTIENGFPIRLVGPPGFEPGTSCTPSRRASQAAPRPECLILAQTASATPLYLLLYLSPDAHPGR